ncbi:MAG: hypothetical protein KAW02_01190 [candidate division Zixibacteria bacterium]|nr:hypothetical protein [candidate division Zixibacteria bacterium]
MVHSSIHTTLNVYNILGQLVRTLVDEEMVPGNYHVIWDEKDNQSKPVSSGIYFHKLKIEKFKKRRKMITLK